MTSSRNVKQSLMAYWAAILSNSFLSDRTIILLQSGRQLEVNGGFDFFPSSTGCIDSGNPHRIFEPDSLSAELQIHY